MDHSQIEELIEQRKVDRIPYADIKRVDENTLNINGHIYSIEENVRDAFDIAEFANCFNPIFTHFDYIVGDWGYGQLRLKGFYKDDRQVEQDLKHNAIPDYIVDYANFGSNYFVIHNLEPVTRPERKKNHKRATKKSFRRKKNAKQANNNNNQKKQNNKPSNPQNNQRHKFTIRQKNGD